MGPEGQVAKVTAVSNDGARVYGRSCLAHYRLAMVATPWRLGASPLNRMADQQPSSICRTIVEWQRPLWMVDLDA